MPKVVIVMGSDSDLPVVKNAIKVLKHFGIQMDVRVISAHRTPEMLTEFVGGIQDSGTEVIISAAGKAAHLPGVLAAQTLVPVIGIPIKSSFMDGMDSLLSIVQMPRGIPVATVGINGAENAALLAVQMLSLKYPELIKKLGDHRENMAKEVAEKDSEIKGTSY